MKPFLLPEPVWDTEWVGQLLSEDATYRWLLLSYGFNLRLIAVPHGERNGPDYAWCYPRDEPAVLDALAAFDPDTQDEPLGWHKRPGSAVRKAPRREENPEYNRPRCQHGSYLTETCKDPFCPDFTVGSTSTSKPRRECGHCGRMFSVNKDGRLQRHQGTDRHPLGHKMLTCPGGNQ
jgi:hypothetical protein